MAHIKLNCCHNMSQSNLFHCTKNYTKIRKSPWQQHAIWWHWWCCGWCMVMWWQCCSARAARLILQKNRVIVYHFSCSCSVLIIFAVILLFPSWLISFSASFCNSYFSTEDFFIWFKNLKFSSYWFIITLFSRVYMHNCTWPSQWVP